MEWHPIVPTLTMLDNKEPKMTNPSKRTEGQALVELALILPFLLFLIFGFIESARMMQAYLAIQSAAREGARYAITGQPYPDECLDLGYPEEQYRECRVDSIKATALEHTVGLPVNPTETDPTRPGYLGIQIWGQSCWLCEPELDQPGIPGTRMEVAVYFNLPIAVPMFSSFLPAVQLTGRAQMVNEGFQSGHQSDPPPTLPPAPTPVPPDSDGDLVCDLEERNIYGTSPKLFDTDGDDLSDGAEIGDFLCDGQPVGSTISDPLDPCDPWPGTDHDDDGLTDCEEEGWECLDPYNSDTDGDGWPDGYELSPQCEDEHPEGCHPCDPSLPHTLGTPTPTPEDTPVPTDTPGPTDTPTPPTPTSTPSAPPTLTIVSPAPACGPAGQGVTFSVSGSNWPTDGDSVVAFSWDGTDSTARAKTGYASATPDAGGNLTATFTVAGTYATSGTHTLYARRLYAPYDQNSKPYYVPCEGASVPPPWQMDSPEVIAISLDQGGKGSGAQSRPLAMGSQEKGHLVWMASRLSSLDKSIFSLAIRATTDEVMS